MYTRNTVIIPDEAATQLLTTGNFTRQLLWVGGSGNVEFIEPKGEEKYQWALRAMMNYPQKHGWKIIGNAPEWAKSLAAGAAR